MTSYNDIFTASVKITGTDTFTVATVPIAYQTNLNNGNVVLKTSFHDGAWTKADFIGCSSDELYSGSVVVGAAPGGTGNFWAPSCANVLETKPFVNFLFFTYTVTLDSGSGGGGGGGLPPVFEP